MKPTPNTEPVAAQFAWLAAAVAAKLSHPGTADAPQEAKPDAPKATKPTATETALKQRTRAEGE
jgi:hypothetical protein